ncbi:MAG: hypothetical protein A4E36_01639 [Methanoregulaceae archaeon PtaB.Bin009]|nr:MAG: hypothetical protein A4E36_01639 [Methanoregulaceae archaeon PtaB.Bin009]
MSEMSFIEASSRTAPDGFEGELTTTILVRGVTRSSTLSLTWNAFVSRG